MRRVRLLACVACLLWIAAVPAWADGNKDKAPGNPASPAKATKARQGHKTVALLDLNTLFKNDAGLKRQMAALKAEVDVAGASIKKEGEAIKILSDRLAALPPDSTDYKTARDELLKHQADLQGRMQAQKQDFVQRQFEDLLYGLPTDHSRGGQVCQREQV